MAILTFPTHHLSSLESLGFGRLHGLCILCESYSLRQECMGWVMSRGSRDIQHVWQKVHWSSLYTRGVMGKGRPPIFWWSFSSFQRKCRLWMSEKAEYGHSLTHKLGLIYTINMILKLKIEEICPHFLEMSILPKYCFFTQTVQRTIFQVYMALFCNNILLKALKQPLNVF